MFGGLLRRFEKLSTVRVGVAVLVVLLVVGIALFQKSRIADAIKPGDKMQAVFARDYQLRPDHTKVKIAGVPVGVVVGVDHESNGTTVATLKLHRGIQDRLRDEPSAAIRPATLLGGSYYVELTPGGDPGTTSRIPVARTTTPVELDRVLEVLQPPARTSTQRTIHRLDDTLGKRGQASVHQLAKTAPSTLRPLTPVLHSLRGEHPNTDLSSLVPKLEATGRALTAQPGDLGRALDGLATTSNAMASSSNQVARTVADLPQTLRTTRSGLRALDHSLVELRSVSDDARPTARQLAKTLRALDPALVATRPVLSDLRPALTDLRPMVSDLVPSAQLGTTVLNNVDGAPLDRVKGPVVKAINSSWHGTTGGYAKDGGSTVLYKELGDMIAGLDNASKMTDRNGATLAFQPGIGVGSVSGTPISFEQLLMALAYPQGAPS